MADSKISGLTEQTSPASADWMEVEPSAGGTSQKVQIGNLGVGGGTPAFDRGTARWYWMNVGQTSTTNGTFALDQVMYSPYVVWGDETLDRIGVEVVTGQTSNTVRLGLYNSGGGYPSTLITDYGTVDTSTSGSKTITISTALTPGTYWVAYVSQGGTACTVRAVQNDWPLRGAFWTSATQSDIFSISIRVWVETGVTGALPSTATPVQQINALPLMLGRRSA